MIRIVILQRGWILVGDISRDANEITVSLACVIRRWGTTKGLGELYDGPTPKTVLDPSSTWYVHPLMVIGQVAIDEEKWRTVLHKAHKVEPTNTAE